MVNKSEKISENQVECRGQWVDTKNFRSWVFNGKDKKLVNSYDEYQAAIASGIWYATEEDASQSKRKLNNVIRPTSK